MRFSFGRDCENSSRIRSTTTEDDVEACSGLLLACEVGEDRGPDCACAMATLAEAALPVCSISRILISLSSVCSRDSGTVDRTTQPGLKDFRIKPNIHSRSHSLKHEATALGSRSVVDRVDRRSTSDPESKIARRLATCKDEPGTRYRPSSLLPYSFR
jgi:hypothetical protein